MMFLNIILYTLNLWKYVVFYAMLKVIKWSLSYDSIRLTKRKQAKVCTFSISCFSEYQLMSISCLLILSLWTHPSGLYKTSRGLASH